MHTKYFKMTNSKRVTNFTAAWGSLWSDMTACARPVCVCVPVELECKWQNWLCISCRREVSHFVAAGFGSAGGKGTDYLSAGQKARVCTCNFETKGEIKGELVKRVVAWPEVLSRSRLKSLSFGLTGNKWFSQLLIDFSWAKRFINLSEKKH